TGERLIATGNGQADYDDLCAILGHDCSRLKIDEKTGEVTFDTTGLDLSENEGAKLINDLVSSKNTYEFREDSTFVTDKGTIKFATIKPVDFLLNLPSFGDQSKWPWGPRAGVSDLVVFNFNAF